MIYNIKDATLRNIANSIRNKNNMDEPITPEDMPALIESISGGSSSNILKRTEIPENSEGENGDICLIRRLEGYTDTGLGWYAPSKKLSSASGTLIERISPRSYYSYSNKPVTAIHINTASGSTQYNTGPLLLSTNPEYVTMTTSEDSVIHYYTPPKNISYVEYKGLNWYTNINYTFNSQYNPYGGLTYYTESITLLSSDVYIMRMSAERFTEIVQTALDKIGVLVDGYDRFSYFVYIKTNNRWEAIL